MEECQGPATKSIIPLANVMNRRQFAFWVGFGLFSLGDRLRVYGLDDLAAAAMRATDAASPASAPSAEDAIAPVHWTAAENRTWRWFEREDYIDGNWKLTGITTPVHKKSGEPKVGPGYLDETVAPEALRLGKDDKVIVLPPEVEAEYARRQPKAKLRARHGRPPSKWLRSLHADELRIWLKTIDPPEAGVSGMTYWEHLTRDHSFDEKRIQGLTIDEQAKLHAAAHHGY
jgi:hypothetical protein